MERSRILRPGVCFFLLVVSAIARASGQTQLGLRTKVSAAADTQRMNSMVVTEIFPGSLAGKAGLKVGDEVLKLNGLRVCGEPIHHLWYEKQSIRSENTMRVRIWLANGVT